MLTTGFLTLLLLAGVQWTRWCSQALHIPYALGLQLHGLLGLEVGRQTGRRAVETRWIQHV